jgi:DNA-binding CsgD family transcriptional regulator
VTKDIGIDPRSQRMLELLATGAGSRHIAKEMGYQEGTMRVYLHNLYRKLGVANKTEAVVWYLQRTGVSPARDTPAATLSVAIPRAGEDLFGEMALAEGLYAALGVMGAFVGPFGRVWEVGTRLSGEEVDAAQQGRRARARALWNALLDGDFARSKAMYDADDSVAMWMEAPADAVLFVALLAIGGYSDAARHFAARLTDRRRSYGHLPPRDAALLRTLFEALEGEDAAIARLAKAAESSGPPAPRQLAQVLLFHVYRSRKDGERARQVANVLWSEAEGARKELHSMGDRGLGARPGAAPAAARSAAREKATAR